MNRFGIDLGGTKIEGVVVDSANPARALFRERTATGAEMGRGHIVSQVARLVERMEKACGTSRPELVGIGTPGVIDPGTGALKNSNTACLNGAPLGEELAQALGTQVRLANDANCFALAEASFGAAKGRGVVFGVILGTGVGGGIVVGGRVLEGPHGIAGEWGHNPMRGEDTPCYCGRRGCVETVISGPALEAWYRARSGNDERLRQIVARAQAGESDAAATMDRLVDKFGEAVAAVINLLDPDAIVLGGGVGTVGALYEPRARDAILRHLFNAELKTPLLRPVLGDSAGVFGAALLGS